MGLRDPDLPLHESSKQTEDTAVDSSRLSLELESLSDSSSGLLRAIRDRLRSLDTAHPKLLGYVEFALKAGILGCALSPFVPTCSKVVGRSMEPNVHDGDRILASRFTEVDRFDLIIFNPPHDPDVTFIKRVIGLPGECLELRSGKLFINQEEIPQPAHQSWDGTFGPIIIPDGAFFVLGDNRPRSMDSRDFGMVEIAKAEIQEVLFNSGSSASPGVGTPSESAPWVDWQKIIAEVRSLGTADDQYTEKD